VIHILVVIEILDIAMVQAYPLELGASLVATIHDGAGADVLKLDLDLGAAPAHLDVLVVEDAQEFAIHLNYDALLEFTC
jgi:hypothetical protein